MSRLQAFNIEDFGQARLLFIFAPSVKSPGYEAQRRLLDTEQQAFEAYDLTEVSVLVEGTSTFGNEGMDEESAAELRRRFEIEDEDCFRIILVEGGREKHRYDAPVQPEALYAELDHRPMQERESEEEPMPVKRA